MGTVRRVGTAGLAASEVEGTPGQGILCAVHSVKTVGTPAPASARIGGIPGPGCFALREQWTLQSQYPLGLKALRAREYFVAQCDYKRQ